MSSDVAPRSQRTNRRQVLIGAIASLFIIGAAQAAEPEAIGHVKVARGDVRIIVDGMSETSAKPGSPVSIGSTVVTGPDSSVGITLRDNTLLALGPDSRLTLDAFRFAPAKGELGLLVTLLKGTLEFVSGAIARLRPEAVKVRTPTSTIGVRGTRFLVKVDD